MNTMTTVQTTTKTRDLIKKMAKKEDRTISGLVKLMAEERFEQKHRSGDGVITAEK